MSDSSSSPDTPTSASAKGPDKNSETSSRVEKETDPETEAFADTAATAKPIGAWHVLGADGAFAPMPSDEAERLSSKYRDFLKEASKRLATLGLQAVPINRVSSSDVAKPASVTSLKAGATGPSTAGASKSTAAPPTTYDSSARATAGNPVSVDERGRDVGGTDGNSAKSNEDVHTPQNVEQ